jgi:crotonobetainyl-CoA:carnitine CoA-transferase CaiB-like acyl-CoA transferase
VDDPAPDELAGVFAGVRVVEVATWQFVPGAAAMMADLGADVVKVENTTTGDGQRAMTGGGLMPTVGDLALPVEQANRGKRSLSVDLRRDAGREVLERLTASADVFMTNFLPEQRRKLRIDVDDVRAIRPDVVYLRAEGVGRLGPDAGQQGFDPTAFWSRSGIAAAVGGGPPATSRPGLGDRTSSVSAAFGVAAALFRRATTGRGAVVDVSLLASALWSSASDVIFSAAADRDFTTVTMGRPFFETADGRWVAFSATNENLPWAELFARLGRGDLADDERFATAPARARHREALNEELAAAFRADTLEGWRARLAGFKGPVAPVNSLLDVTRDPQVLANGYLTWAEAGDGLSVPLVRAPVQIDEELPALGRAPRLGQHSREVLAELGYDAAAIEELVTTGAVRAEPAAGHGTRWSSRPSAT